MDHRWNTRKEVATPRLIHPLLIQQGAVGIIAASVRNISAGGMLVATRGGALQPGAVIELTAGISGTRRCKLFPLKALVIHATDGLAGLMFTGDEQITAAFRNCLEDACRKQADPPRERNEIVAETGIYMMHH